MRSKAERFVRHKPSSPLQSAGTPELHPHEPSKGAVCLRPSLQDLPRPKFGMLLPSKKKPPAERAGGFKLWSNSRGYFPTPISLRSRTAPLSALEAMAA